MLQLAREHVEDFDLKSPLKVATKLGDLLSQARAVRSDDGHTDRGTLPDVVMTYFGNAVGAQTAHPFDDGAEHGPLSLDAAAGARVEQNSEMAE